MNQNPNLTEPDPAAAGGADGDHPAAVVAADELAALMSMTRRPGVAPSLDALRGAAPSPDAEYQARMLDADHCAVRFGGLPGTAS